MSSNAQRRWFVTGASRGLGHAIASVAIARGDKVCLVARGAEITEVAKALGDNAMGVQANVSDVQDLSRATSAMVER